MSIPRQRRYVTQADIAEKAGVSRALVSQILRGSTRVSEKNRKLILDTAAEMGYVGSAVATSLAGNRPYRMIGLLLQTYMNPLFIDIWDGLADVLGRPDYQILAMQGGLEAQAEDLALQSLVSFMPDAIVLAGYSGSTDALGAAAKNIPVVSVTRQVNLPREHTYSVLGDDYYGGCLVTEYLQEKGHTRIGHLRLPSGLPYDERSSGYEDTMKKAGLSPLLIDTPLSQEGAHEVVAQLLENDQLPTALFCANDLLALGALDALREKSLRVPQDISLVGYDATEVALRCGLTTVDQYGREQGERAGRILAKVLSHPNAGRIARVETLQPVLVKGKTVTTPHS